MTGGLFKSASTLAILAAVGLMAGGMTMTPKAAYAADLGGDCCADLEERVAELEATTARKGNKKVSLTIAGRVNANMLYWNDGFGVDKVGDESRDLYFGNHGGSESRFQFKGEGKVNKDVVAGYYMEIRNDFSVDQTADQTVDQHGPGLQARNQYVYLKSGSMGEVRLGRTGSASGDGWYQELGAATLGGLAGDRFVGGFKLRTADKALTAYTYSKALGEWTDSSSINRIWYATPNLGGFVGKISYGGDDAIDASVVWSGDLNKTLKLSAGAGYNEYVEHEVSKGGFGKGTKETDYGFSGSIFETGSGLFLTGAYGVATTDNTAYMNKTFYMIHGGWQKNVTGMGLTTIDAQYYKAENGVTDFNKIDKAVGLSSNATTFGAGIDQAIDSVASNAYLRYQRDTFNPSAGLLVGGKALESQSIDSFTAGMIVRF